MDAPKRITQMENGVEVEYEATGEYRQASSDEHWLSDIDGTIRTNTNMSVRKVHIYRLAPPADEVKVGDVFQYPGKTPFIIRVKSGSTVQTEDKKGMGKDVVDDILHMAERLPAMPVEVGQVWMDAGNNQVVITYITNVNIQYRYTNGEKFHYMANEDFHKYFTFHGWSCGDKVEASVECDRVGECKPLTTELVYYKMENQELKKQLTICNADNETKERIIGRQTTRNIEIEKERDYYKEQTLALRTSHDVIVKERDNLKSQLRELKKDIGILNEIFERFTKL